MKQRVSDKITIREIKTWNNDVVTITAGTGAGKSFFIKNILYQFAKENGKKILMLIHRKNCVDQFKAEIENDKKDDIIDIKTYQCLEQNEIKHKNFDFTQYQYIVCDEFHYFMGDAAFNKSTDISLNIILNQKHATRILMSATGDYVKNYINNIKGITTKDYPLPINYDFIENLFFFNKDETLENLLQETIQKRQKAIFFIQSAEKAYNLYRKYKDHCLFNCSKSNEKFYKHVDEKKIDQMLVEEKFSDLVLISTTCLDAGVNIIDTDLKNIIVDVVDIDSLIQCIGRKRIQDKHDKINLYIKAITNKQLGGKETQIQNKLKMAEFFKTHTVKEYIEKFYKQYDKSHMVYDITVDEADKGTKKLNELMYSKCKFDLAEINTIKSYGEYGYCKYLAKLFGFYNEFAGYYDYNVLEDMEDKDNIENFLDSIVGKYLYKEEQKELINKINLRDARNRQQKSISQLNLYLQENKIPFTIISKTGRLNKQLIRFWNVVKLEENIKIS